MSLVQKKISKTTFEYNAEMQQYLNQDLERDILAIAKSLNYRYLKEVRVHRLKNDHLAKLRKKDVRISKYDNVVNMYKRRSSKLYKKSVDVLTGRGLIYGISETPYKLEMNCSRYIMGDRIRFTYVRQYGNESLHIVSSTWSMTFSKIEIRRIRKELGY